MLSVLALAPILTIDLAECGQVDDLWASDHERARELGWEFDAWWRLQVRRSGSPARELVLGLAQGPADAATLTALRSSGLSEARQLAGAIERHPNLARSLVSQMQGHLLSDDDFIRQTRRTQYICWNLRRGRDGGVPFSRRTLLRVTRGELAPESIPAWEHMLLFDGRDGDRPWLERYGPALALATMAGSDIELPPRTILAIDATLSEPHDQIDQRVWTQTVDLLSEALSRTAREDALRILVRMLGTTDDAGAPSALSRAALSAIERMQLDGKSGLLEQLTDELPANSPERERVERALGAF